MTTSPPGRLELLDVRPFLGANRYVDFAAVCAVLRLADGVAADDDAPHAIERLAQVLDAKPADAARWRSAVAAARRSAGDASAQHGLLALAALAGALSHWLLGLEPLEVRVLANRARAHECLVACADEPGQETAGALQLAVRAIQAAREPTAGDPAQYAQLREAARGIGRIGRSRALDQTVKLLRDRARERGIPWWRPSPLSRVIYLGEGVHAHPYFESASDRSSIPSRNMAFDKRVTAQLLHTLGLPGVRHRDAASVEDAIAIAQRIGFPVVVKPSGGGKGMGVTVGVRDPAALRTAFANAQAASPTPVLVERFVPGDHHRLLVVGGRLVAVARLEPATVVGDGRSTVSELVDAVNADPRRGEGFESPLVRIVIDDEARRLLAARGLSPESVPAAGERAVLRGMSNIAQGGDARDLTASAHPDVRWMAETIAASMRLDATGIDYITPDVSRSWKDVGGAVCEVNVMPGMRPHLAGGMSPALLADAILEHHFPNGADGRVPTVAVTGSSGGATVCRLVKRILEARGHVTGLACSDGLYVGEQLVTGGDFADAMGPPALRANVRVQAAVYECTRGGLARHGVAFDACDVAALLNVGTDHVGVVGIASIDDIARLKALILPTARRGIVLNADDERCRALGRGVAPERVTWFGTKLADGFLRSAIGSGARGACLDDGAIAVADAQGVHRLGVLADFQITHGGRAGHNVTNLLAAAAIGAALSIEPTTISAALRGAGPSDVPGRQSLFDLGDSSIVLDRADSPAELRALAEFTMAIASGRPRTLVFTCPGDRTDDQARAMAREAAGLFERFIVYDWRQLRGRAPGEISRILAGELVLRQVKESAIIVEPDQDRALQLAARSFPPAAVLAIVSFDLHDDTDVEALLSRFEAGPNSTEEAMSASAATVRVPISERTGLTPSG